MNFNLSAYNTSYLLDAAYEALSQRKAFLNFDPTKYFFFCLAILFIKCVISGYCMVHLVRRKVTYTFLFFYICANLLLRKSWLDLAGEIFHAAAHIGVLTYVNDVTEYAPSFPNIMIWYYYSAFSPAEFFLDCYFGVAIFSYLFEAYIQKPHKLTSMIVVLFGVNWLSDQFVSGSASSTFHNVVNYYIPLIWIDTFMPTGEEINVVPEIYAAVWVIYKVSQADFSDTPAARLKQSLEIQYGGWGFMDYLTAIINRGPILSVNYDEHYVLFSIILLMKGFFASYAAKHVIGIKTTLKMLFVNFILCFCDKHVYTVLAGFVRFIFIGTYQYLLNLMQYNTAFSAGIWYWVSCDDHFHFFLDVFLIVSALVHIEDVYTGAGDRLSTLLCCLYAVDCFGNKFIGEPLGVLATIASLYFPVVLISACRELGSRWKKFSILVFITLWLVFKHKGNFEYGVKYIHTFKETVEAVSTDL